MPVYPFQCEFCDRTTEVTASMQEVPKRVECRFCGGKTVRVYSFRQSNCEYSRVIHSDSLAISPEQVAEHREKFPNIEIDSECRPVFKNFKDHDDYLEKTGFVKQRARKTKRHTRFGIGRTVTTLSQIRKRLETQASGNE